MITSAFMVPKPSGLHLPHSPCCCSAVSLSCSLLKIPTRLDLPTPGSPSTTTLESPSDVLSDPRESEGPPLSVSAACWEGAGTSMKRLAACERFWCAQGRGVLALLRRGARAAHIYTGAERGSYRSVQREGPGVSHIHIPNY